MSSSIDWQSPMAGRKVLVLGLGQSGLAMARWCARLGAEPVVVDTRADPPGLAALRGELPQVSFLQQDLGADLIEAWQPVLVAVSPGLSPAERCACCDAAAGKGIAVVGELGLFVQVLGVLRERLAYAPKVLAVTGTNGKTTVTALTGLLLERAGRKVKVAGNISPSLLDALGVCIDAQTLPEAWVVELSSFQLDAVQGFAPDAATVLNLTQDHLDWHPDMQAYADAKARIFGPQGLMVLPRGDARVMAMLPAPSRARGGRMVARAHVTFGLDLPARAGDLGLETVNGMTWLVRALDNGGELYLQRLMPADALRIRGRHNALNALAALALALAIDCPLAPMLHALREYRGEPHRLQSVAVIDGVEFFNDSKGTNVGATVAALHGLGATQKLVLILGGEGKGQDFSPLAEPMHQHARGAVLIGRDAPLIRKALSGVDLPLVDAATMSDAVRTARSMARNGDAVVLSPACASFDMFRNYPHRGEVFAQAVAALAAESGIALEGVAS